MLVRLTICSIKELQEQVNIKSELQILLFTHFLKNTHNLELIKHSRQ